MHVGLVYDSTPASPGAANMGIWVNWVWIPDTAYTTTIYPAQDDATQWNLSGTAMALGRSNYPPGPSYADIYVAEIIHLDGYAVSGMADFGAFDTRGQWAPIDPTDTVTANKGANRFWLDFANSGDLGNDVSGNGNDLTPVNIGSANTTAMSPSDDGDKDVGNFAVLNPLYKSSGVTLSNGNLIATNSASHGFVRATIPVAAGRYICEFTDNDGNGWCGVCTGQAGLSTYLGYDDYGWAYAFNGELYHDGGSTASWGATYTTDDVIRIELDMDTGSADFLRTVFRKTPWPSTPTARSSSLAGHRARP